MHRPRKTSITNRSRHNRTMAVVLLLGLALNACQSAPPLPPIRTAAQVDLPRFMGEWYVLGNIPTFIEKQAFNAREHYALNDDGSVATTFTFNKGAFDGPEKIYHPKGFIRDTDTNAVWGMQFIWPFKAEYRVLFVNEAYDQAVIGRSKRDYLWIMARTPSLSTASYEALERLVAEQGYDVAKIRRVPHRDSDAG